MFILMIFFFNLQTLTTPHHNVLAQNAKFWRPEQMATLEESSENYSKSLPSSLVYYFLKGNVHAP